MVTTALTQNKLPVVDPWLSASLFFPVFFDASSPCLSVWTGICRQTAVRTWCKRRRCRQGELTRHWDNFLLLPCQRTNQICLYLIETERKVILFVLVTENNCNYEFTETNCFSLFSLPKNPKRIETCNARSQSANRSFCIEAYLKKTC